MKSTAEETFTKNINSWEIKSNTVLNISRAYGEMCILNNDKNTPVENAPTISNT